MIEKIPEEISDLPDDPGRKAAKAEFLDAFIDMGCWEKDGDDGRSALVLLGQLIAVSVETESIRRLAARIHHFLENEVVRRDFVASLGDDVLANTEIYHDDKVSDQIRKAQVF